MARAFILNSERVPRLLNRTSDALNAAREVTEPDARIEAHLQFYQLSYEGLSPALLAPVVVGMGLASAADPAHFRLDSDGRIRLSALIEQARRQLVVVSPGLTTDVVNCLHRLWSP